MQQSALYPLSPARKKPRPFIKNSILENFNTRMGKDHDKQCKNSNLRQLKTLHIIRINNASIANRDMVLTSPPKFIIFVMPRRCLIKPTSNSILDVTSNMQQAKKLGWA
jgi:hypothetical protein